MRGLIATILMIALGTPVWSGVGDTYTCIGQSVFEIPDGQKEFRKESSGGRLFKIQHTNDYLIFINPNNTVVKMRIYEHFLEENIVYATASSNTKTPFPYDGFIVFKDGLLLILNGSGFRPKQYGSSFFKNYANVSTAICSK